MSTTRADRTSDRGRRLLSYVVSLVVHGSILVSLGPCIPDVPGLIHVERLAPTPDARKAGSQDRFGERVEADLHRGTLPEGSPQQAADPAEAEGGPPDRQPPSASPPLDRDKPDPPKLLDPEDSVRVVHTEEPGERPEEADAESAHDRRAVEERRAAITAPDEGPTTPAQESATARTVASGGEHSPAEQAAGGARPAAAAAAAAPPPPAPAEARTGGSERASVPPGQDPEWWAPIATRVRPASAPEDDVIPTEEEEEQAAELALEPDEDRPTPPEPEDRSEPTPEEPALADGPGGVDAGEVVLDEGAEERVEPDEDPSEQPDEDAVADAVVAGAAQQGIDPTVDQAALPASSHQTVVDAREAETAEVAATATARGAWIQRVDEVVRKRWASRELPVHLQGIGIRGEATVQFLIQPNGRTSDPELVRKSGNEWLDAYALDAIPDRVPRMPRDLEPVAVEHQITFRYR